MAYVNKLKGIVADVPEVWFKRIDGKMFHFSRLSACNVTPNVEFTPVNGGQGLFPFAYLATASTLEMTMTSAEFDSSLFALAHGTEFAADATLKVPVTENLAVSSNAVTLSNAAADDSEVIINGMSRVTNSPSQAGQYKVTTSEGSTSISFYNGDFSNNDIVEISYTIAKSNAMTMQTTLDQAAIGEVVCRWPVYNTGENVSGASFSGASVLGYMQIRIYRARVTAMPGFDTSYKTAATNQITIATMDPGNAGHDGNAFEYNYYKNA